MLSFPRTVRCHSRVCDFVWARLTTATRCPLKQRRPKISFQARISAERTWTKSSGRHYLTPISKRDGDTKIVCRDLASTPNAVTETEPDGAFAQTCYHSRVNQMTATMLMLQLDWVSMAKTHLDSSELVTMPTLPTVLQGRVGGASKPGFL